MSNPSISFRISKYHLARALHVIRQLEPNYKIVSMSHIVKTCFFDYITKMNLNRSLEIPPSIIIEIDNFLSSKAKTGLSLEDIIEINSQMIDQESAEELSVKTDHKPSNEKSTITSVSDFSPLKEWTDSSEE
jgi:hypothetical protein